MVSVKLDGIINVLKPPGMTSHDVVGFIRRTLGIKKVGHTGTLDPGVAGVLPVCLGNATKIIEYMNDVKYYRAELTFGRSTDTQDGFGNTVRVRDASGLSEDVARNEIIKLIGQHQQVPPMVSAVKHKGRKLYELAREGLEVERKARLIDIFSVSVIQCKNFGTPEPSIIFDIKCSKGTYVRTICNDLGENLGYYGFMSFLVRMGTGRFSISEALTLEELSDLAARDRIADAILPFDLALDMDSVWIYDSVVKAVCHGNRIFPPGIQKRPELLKQNQIVKLLNSSSGFLAVAQVLIERNPQEDHERYLFQPIKVFC